MINSINSKPTAFTGARGIKVSDIDTFNAIRESVKANSKYLLESLGQEDGFCKALILSGEEKDLINKQNINLANELLKGGDVEKMNEVTEKRTNSLRSFYEDAPKTIIKGFQDAANFIAKYLR